jgi:hypothetical protein
MLYFILGFEDSPDVSELLIGRFITKFFSTLAVSLLLYGCDGTVPRSGVKYTGAVQNSQVASSKDSTTKSVFQERPIRQPRDSVAHRARQTQANDSVTGTQESQRLYAKTRFGEHDFQTQSSFGDVGKRKGQPDHEDYRFRPQNTAKRYQPYLSSLSHAPYDYQGLTTGGKAYGLNNDDNNAQEHMEYELRLPDSAR